MHLATASASHPTAIPQPLHNISRALNPLRQPYSSMDSHTHAELDEIENDPEADVDANSLAIAAPSSIPQTPLHHFHPDLGVQTPLSNSLEAKKRPRSPEEQVRGLRGPRLANSGQSPNELKRPRKNPPFPMGATSLTHLNTSMSAPAPPADLVAKSRISRRVKDARCEYLLKPDIPTNFRRSEYF